MTHPTVFGGATPPPANYRISNSVRGRPTAITYFSRTIGTPTSTQKYTISFWHKFGPEGLYPSGYNAVSAEVNVSTSTSTFSRLAIFGASPDANMGGTARYNGSSYDLSSYNGAALYRDPTSWYHCVIAVDTTQAAGNRVRIYVNGGSVAVSGSEPSPGYAYPELAAGAAMRFLRMPIYYDSGPYGPYSAGGYVAEFHYIDGQQLSASDFGKLDSNGVWVPIRYAGTYGANGCKLEFKDGGALGTDTSGNGNHWTAHGFTAADQMVDTPTNNYCTINPLDWGQATATISDGNLTISTDNIDKDKYRGTIGVSSGKWYFRMKVNAGNAWEPTIGVHNEQPFVGVSALGYNDSNGWGIGPNAQYANGGAWMASGLGVTWAAGDYINIAIDLTNLSTGAGRLYIGKNGTWLNSANPDSGTGAFFTNLSGSVMFPACSGGSAGASGTLDFQSAAPANATTFKTLCTANLPASTITQPSEHFQSSLYTGTAPGSGQSVSLPFAPDLVWIKRRSSAASHYLIDKIRGVNQAISSNSTGAETTIDINQFVSFDPLGFTLGNVASNAINSSGDSMVAWSWKAGGPAVSNTAGSITSSVSANPTAGFSIVTFTGNGVASTVGHGLGAAPAMIIQKARTPTAMHWMVYHKAANASPATGHLYLELTNAFTSDSTSWNNTMPTATVWSVGTGASSNTNYNGAAYVAYCFAEIPGYSKFGSYTGNGSSDGPFVYCGFRPRWIMLKRTDLAGDWYCYDTARDTGNVAFHALYLGKSNPEDISTVPTALDVLSNGFKLRNVNSSDFNVSGGQFIYAAFAEHPFGGANVAPSPAR